MKKILHMSDLHIGYKNFLERFHEIVIKLIDGVVGDPSGFIIVITGDLVENANNYDSYKQIKNELIILKDAGFENVLVVPGNHDYGTGSFGDKKFVNLFKQNFFNENRIYPITDVIDDIAFIGLDSMAAELHWYDLLWAEGELGQEQLNRLNNLLRKDDIQSCKKRVIYLHHHPFDRKPLHQLKDSNKLCDILAGVIRDDISIDAILYGHNHEGKSNNGHWGIQRCYDAGSVNLKPRSRIKNELPWFDKVENSTRVIDLGKNPDVDYKLNFFDIE
jgi:3',5'-cyclic AMP phosphodiesterase CpdA